ncbi:stress-inducible protein [Chrysochromulina tobinii]|uniref:Stress-inducible protein n=1 Tax=Chrysochromulina tobinii TaxID=1460289 RepID=A0A0M0J8L8_9EUKA|nr:stress-inducible protein [Chrysochromulina tobinii]|eukprot:KOO22558.1 stress-inducible protein [Chrysochromulina sp. CCMP291]
MEPLLREDSRVLEYNGLGCSLGMIGHTALHWAASKGYASLAKWLLDEGHNVNAINNANSTPLHTASQNGQSAVVNMLLSAGCDTKLVNTDDQTAYDVAVEKGHSQIARNIAEAGAQAVLPSLLSELQARDEGTWKVAEMKQALKLSKVDTDGVSEKAELRQLLREVLDKAAPALAAKPMAEPKQNSAPAPAPAPPPPAAPAPPSEAPAEKPPSPPKKASAPMQSKLDALDDSDDEDASAAQQAGAERAKALGNDAFGRGDYTAAVKHFGAAIRLTPKNYVLYSNRSGAHASLGNASEALSDANECIKLAPDWAKGYSRKGAALILKGEYKDAMKAYKAGLAIEPQNAALLKGLEDLRASLREVLHSACSSGQAFSVEWLLKHGADATLKNDDGETPSAVATKKGRKDLAATIERHLQEPLPQAGHGKAQEPSGNATDSSAPPSWGEHREEVD